MSSTESKKKAAAQRHRVIRAKSPTWRADGSPPRFVADVMLGRLAKWLRIAGFDVLYSNRYSDDELVALSEREGRILLSRDTRLLVRKSVKQFIFPESEQLQDQIRQVLDRTRTTSLPGVLSRCVDCNTPLCAIERARVRDRVPPFVYRTQKTFKFCEECTRVYWAGTHRRAVLTALDKLLPR